MTPKALGLIVSAGVLGVVALGMAKAEPGERARLAASAMPSGSAGFRHPRPDWADGFRKKRPDPKEIQAHIAEFRASAAARRAEHMSEIRQRFGPKLLGTREFAEEFRHHARRMAFLRRAKFVATTELEEPKRTAALARIDKLTEREQARHERRVEKLKSNQPSPGPSGAPSAAASAAPAPSGSSR
jgi:hypothetical protein